MLLQLYSQYSLNYYCKLFGKSRQAYYEQKNKPEKDGFEEALILKLVAEIRKDLPRCGTDKLYFMLKNEFMAHQIKIGRDGLYPILGEYGLLIRYRKRKPYTTNSNHFYKKYPILIRNLTVFEAGKLWVSDITYIRINTAFAYLSIITDAYSHKIVGYKLHPTLHAKGQSKQDTRQSKQDTRQSKQGICQNEQGIRQSKQDTRQSKQDTRQSKQGIRQNEQGIRQSKQDTRQSKQDTRQSKQDTRQSK